MDAPNRKYHFTFVYRTVESRIEKLILPEDFCFPIRFFFGSRDAVRQGSSTSSTNSFFPPHGAIVRVKVSIPSNTNNSNPSVLKKKGGSTQTTINDGKENLSQHLHNVQKAIEAGFVHRPLVDMIKDQIEGYKNRYPKDDIKFGEQTDGTVKCYSASKEKEIINKWKVKMGF